MAILLLKSATEPKCPMALPFCSPWILQTHWLTWEAQLLAHSLDASPGELAQNGFSTSAAQWKCLGDMRATFLARKFYRNHMLSEVSLFPVISALTGPPNSLLLFSRSHATPSLPSTTIPPTTISAGRNLFYPSPLQADFLLFSQWSQQEKRRSHTWALKSTACLLAGD